jgi:hypothetical protein
MPPQAYVFSESDVKLLRQMADAFRARQGATSGRPNPYVDLQEQPSPETCVFLTPPQGIGPLVLIDKVFYPGGADCEAARVEPSGGLNRVPGLVRFVRNLSTEAVPGAKPILATRDKWGDWWAVGDAYELAPADEAGTGTGTGTGTGSGSSFPGDVLTDCCSPVLLPQTLHLTISSGACPCLDGTYALVFTNTRSLAPPIPAWELQVNNLCNSRAVRFSVWCDGSGNWNLAVECGSTGTGGLGTVHATVSQGTFTCSPLSVDLSTLFTVGNGCCTPFNGFTATLTE